MFTADYYDQPLEDAEGERPAPIRCRWCEEYFHQHESNAPTPASFCSEWCEDESTNAERIR